MKKRIRFQTGETAVTIVSDDEKYFEIAKNAIYEARNQIIGKINRDPFFKNTLEPYAHSENDPQLVKMMCDASILAGVGPMAGVAGAVAYHAVLKMKEAGSGYAIVENGGDIALFIDEDTDIALYSDDESLKNLGLKAQKRKTIFGICSSSGKIGPSISLGNSNVCTVISDNVVLADACATALGNMITDSDGKTLSDALEKIAEIKDVDGCLAVSGGKIAVCGNVLEIIECRFDGEKYSVLTNTHIV